MAKIKKSFILPEPEKIGDEYQWEPIVRLSSVVPFGYKQDPDDPDILLPVPEELEALEEAKVHLKQFSYREVAMWLTDTTGREISHVGLFHRIKSERRRKNKISQAEYWAKRAKEAAEKAEKLASRLGSRDPRVNTDSTG